MKREEQEVRNKTSNKQKRRLNGGTNWSAYEVATGRLRSDGRSAGAVAHRRTSAGANLPVVSLALQPTPSMRPGRMAAITQRANGPNEMFTKRNRWPCHWRTASATRPFHWKVTARSSRFPSKSTHFSWMGPQQQRRPQQTRQTRRTKSEKEPLGSMVSPLWAQFPVRLAAHTSLTLDRI
jgi:hypothetical protein